MHQECMALEDKVRYRGFYPILFWNIWRLWLCLGKAFFNPFHHKVKKLRVIINYLFKCTSIQVVITWTIFNVIMTCSIDNVSNSQPLIHFLQYNWALAPSLLCFGPYSRVDKWDPCHIFGLFDQSTIAFKLCNNILVHKHIDKLP
jgi:hypothetical protein